MKKMLLVPTLALAFILSVFLIGCDLANQQEDYVTIEINPAIDMVLENDKVQSVAALNEDGEILLVNLNLLDKDVDDAIDEIVDEAIDLGFIDPDATETTVEIDSTSETAMNKVQNHFNEAFQERGMFGKAIQKQNDELIDEAEELGVTVGFLRLVYRVIEADDTITFEDALAMEQKDLIDILKNKNAELRMMARELKADFLEQRQVLFDEYLPQIQALEAEIEALEASTEDTSALVQELDQLKAELHDLVAQLRESFQEQGEIIRQRIQTRNQERVNQYEETVSAFRAQMQERARQRRQAIEEFQDTTDTSTTEPVITTTETTDYAGTQTTHLPDQTGNNTDSTDVTSD